MNLMRIFLFLIIFILTFSQVQNPELSMPKINNNLIFENEELLFSFKLINCNRVITVAISKENDYIIFRMGTEDELDLVFPNDTLNSWEFFIYNYYNRGGGAENLGMNVEHLTFYVENVCYKIYYEYTAVNDETKVGIYVYEYNDEGLINNTSTLQLDGDVSSILGGLWKLRDTKVERIML